MESEELNYYFKPRVQIELSYEVTPVIKMDLRARVITIYILLCETHSFSPFLSSSLSFFLLSFLPSFALPSFCFFTFYFKALIFFCLFFSPTLQLPAFISEPAIRLN